jgi:hypothetical protein
MLLEASWNYQHQVRQVAAQIARALNFAELAKLNQRRNEIVVEALEIVQQLNVPEPSECNFHSQPSVK